MKILYMVLTFTCILSMSHLFSLEEEGEEDMARRGHSSYVGTSTGPGPNGGYPSTPRGSYETILSEDQTSFEDEKLSN